MCDAGFDLSFELIVRCHAVGRGQSLCAGWVWKGAFAVIWTFVGA